MERRDLVGTWRKVAVGDKRIDPAGDAEVVTLEENGGASVFYRINGEEHREPYTWQYVDATHWSLQKPLPMVAALAKGMAAAIDAFAYEVVAFSGDAMELKKHIPTAMRSLVEQEMQRLLQQHAAQLAEKPGQGLDAWNPVTRYERVSDAAARSS